MRAAFKFFVIILAAQALVGLGGCKTNEAGQPDIVGALLNYNGCKLLPGGTLERMAQIRMQECLEYDYDGRGTLTLKHVNSGFNCCPGSLTSEVVVTGKLITIIENEEMAGCHCLCLYDLEYRFENLSPGEYTIRFQCPYVPVNETMISIALELSGPAGGQYCLDRNQYPW